MSDEAVSILLDLLTNGLTGQNSQETLQQLRQYQANPDFCQMLCDTLVANDCPINYQLVQPWGAYRKLAGITLKNNIEIARHNLGETVITSSAESCIGMLVNEPESELVQVAAVVVVRITECVGLQWWNGFNIDLASLLMDDLLLSDDNVRVIGALTTLQYLFEDAQLAIGDASERIVGSLTDLVANHGNSRIRALAFRVAYRPFEIGEDLEWGVSILSPMQNGLLNISASMAQCVSAVINGDANNDYTLMTSALRCARTLLNYLDKIADNVGIQTLGEAFTHWVHTSVTAIQQGELATDVASAACDFIGGCCDTCDSAGNVGAIADIITAIDNEEIISALMAALFPCMLLKDEEIAEIMENDAYDRRDLTAGRVGMKRGKASDDDVEDSTLATLRASASAAFSSLLKLNPVTAFPPVLEVLQNHWTDGSWMMREVSMTALSHAAAGAFDQVQEFLPNLVPQLCDTIEQGDEGEQAIICSAALYAMARFTQWIFRQGGDQGLVERCMQAALDRLISTSKRVQATAVLAMRMLCTASFVVHNSAEINAIGEQLAANILQCVPVYHTNNLARLSDLVDDLGEALSGVNGFVDTILGQLGVKYEDFVNSFNDRYEGGNSNRLIDSDVISLATMVASVFQQAPDGAPAESVVQQLDGWCDFLQTLLDRGISDDAQLIMEPLTLCGYFLPCLPSQSLQEWHFGNNGRLMNLAVAFLGADGMAEDVYKAALDSVFNLLSFLGNGAAPDVRSLVEALIPRLNLERNDISVVLDATSVVAEVCKAYGTDKPLLKCVELLTRQLRADAYGETMRNHSQLACRIGSVLQVDASAVPPQLFGRLFYTMSFAMNTDEKRNGTQGAMLAYVNSPNEQAAAGCVSELITLVSSWQTEPDGDLLDAIRRGLQFARDNVGGALQEAMSRLTPGLQNQIMSAYQL